MAPKRGAPPPGPRDVEEHNVDIPADLDQAEEIMSEDEAPYWSKVTAPHPTVEGSMPGGPTGQVALVDKAATDEAPYFQKDTAVDEAETQEQQLDLLLAELKRIEGQQEKLKDAIATNKPLVVHPRRERSGIDTELDEEEVAKPASPKARYVASGGLTGFGVARDLLRIDFSPEEEAPEEYRATAFNAPRPPKGVSGPPGPSPLGPLPNFGMIDPSASSQLHIYLARLEEQQREVLKLIEKGANFGGPTGTAPSRPPAPPVSDAGATAVVVPETSTAAKPSAPLARIERPKWREPPIIDMKFESKMKVQKLKNRPSHISNFGLLHFLLFIAAFGIYMYCRIGHTLNVHSKWFPYEVVFLATEVLLFYHSFVYGLTHLKRLRSDQTAEGGRGKPHPKDPKKPVTDLEGKVKTLKHKYHIQVLVYSPSNNIKKIEEALKAAHAIELPEGCTKIVYLVDPKRETAKMEIVNQLSINGLMYMPGPEVIKSDMDIGKAATLNRALRKIYPRDGATKQSELVVIFDDNQICDKTFLLKTVPLIEGRGVRLVHTPIGYNNVYPSSDIFLQYNHLERAAIPGMESWGVVTCAGTGFVVRADALQKVGWFPTISETEGWAVGAELKAYNYLSHYHDEVLVRGDAPKTLSEVYAERATYARGRFQIYYRGRKAHEGKPGWVAGMLYAATPSTNQLYAILMPFFILVPMIRIWFNVFPVEMNRWFGGGFLIYYCIGLPLVYRAYLPRNLQGIWFQQTAVHLLWFTWLCEALKARFSGGRVPLPKPAPKKSRSKPSTVTASKAAAKGKQPKEVASDTEGEEEQSEELGQAGSSKPAAPPAKQPSRKAGWLAEVPLMPIIVFLLSFSSFLIGGWLLLFTDGVIGHSRKQQTVSSKVIAGNFTLCASILWCLYNSVLALVAILYALQVRLSQRGSRMSAVLYTHVAWVVAWTLIALVPIMTICLGSGEVGGLKPYTGVTDVRYSDALGMSYKFYEAQRSGSLPDGSRIPWRGDSALGDRPSGGWYDHGDSLKVTLPIAVAASTLAWSMVAAPKAYNDANQTFYGLDSLKWAADYLRNCHTDQYKFVGQVGKYDTEVNSWTRPEDLGNATRPSYEFSDTAPGSDVVGQAAAALAATSLAFRYIDYSYSKQALEEAQDLYLFATKFEGLSSKAYADAAKSYPATSFLDDLAYASAWLYYATSEKLYLDNAVTYLNRLRAGEDTAWANLNSDWNNMYWATNVLLAKVTNQPEYASEAERFLLAWQAADGTQGVLKTPSGLSWLSTDAPLRTSSNAAFLSLLYGQKIGFGRLPAKNHNCWARSQIQYVLGDNDARMSFLVGYGDKFPQRVQHAGASCPANQTCSGSKTSNEYYFLNAANPNVLLGALVAGPDAKDQYADSRSSLDSMVGVEYNAGFTGAVALLSTREWLECNERNGFLDEVGVRFAKTAL